MNLPIYILAGGQSRRFGTDKARALLDGEPLISRLADQLKPHATGMTVVADRPDKYADLGLRTIADRTPGVGPLAGLEAAILDATEDDHVGWVLLVSCDLIEVRSEWLRSLYARTYPEPHPRADAHGSPVVVEEFARAVAFREKVWYPFPGIYHTDFLPIVQEYLAGPKASFQRSLSDPRSHAIGLPLPEDWPPLAQVNTREDLRRAMRED